MEKLKSRKLWVAAISAVALWVSALTGVELDQEQLLSIVIPLVAYLLGQSWVDAKNNKP